MSETKRYRVVGTDLCHNGETIREGRTVELTDQEAADLQQFLVEAPVPVATAVTQQTGDAGAGDETATQTDKAPADAKSTTKKGAAK